MTSTLVFPHQRLVLDIANLLSIHMRNVKHVCKLVKLLLSNLALIDNNSVIQVATLYKVCFEQRYDIANKHKCAGWRNLLAKVADIVESCKLAINELRLERAHSCDRKLLIWQNCYTRASFWVLNLYLMLDNIVVFRSILLFDSNLVDFLYILSSRAIEDRELRTVNLNQAVVDAKGIKGCHTMFYSRNADVAFAKHGTTLSINHFLCDSVYNRSAFKVGTLNFVSCIFRCRIEDYC